MRHLFSQRVVVCVFVVDVPGDLLCSSVKSACDLLSVLCGHSV